MKMGFPHLERNRRRKMNKMIMKSKNHLWIMLVSKIYLQVILPLNKKLSLKKCCLRIDLEPIVLNKLSVKQCALKSTKVSQLPIQLCG